MDFIEQQHDKSHDEFLDCARRIRCGSNPEECDCPTPAKCYPGFVLSLVRMKMAHAEDNAEPVSPEDRDKEIKIKKKITTWRAEFCAIPALKAKYGTEQAYVDSKLYPGYEFAIAGVDLEIGSYVERREGKVYPASDFNELLGAPISKDVVGDKRLPKGTKIARASGSKWSVYPPPAPPDRCKDPGREWLEDAAPLLADGDWQMGLAETVTSPRRLLESSRDFFRMRPSYDSVTGGLRFVDVVTNREVGVCPLYRNVKEQLRWQEGEEPWLHHHCDYRKTHGRNSTYKLQQAMGQVIIDDFQDPGLLKKENRSPGKLIELARQQAKKLANDNADTKDEIHPDDETIRGFLIKYYPEIYIHFGGEAEIFDLGLHGKSWFHWYHIAFNRVTRDWMVGRGVLFDKIDRQDGEGLIDLMIDQLQEMFGDFDRGPAEKKALEYFKEFNKEVFDATGKLSKRKRESRV